MKLDKNKLKIIIGITARLITGILFVYAGYLKAVSPVEEFVYSIESYQLFSAKIALVSAQVVPWMEIYLGVFLITGFLTRISSVAITVLLVFFEMLLISAVFRNLTLINCGCFGLSKSNSMEFEISQNFVLIVLSILAYKYGGKALSIDVWANKGLGISGRDKGQEKD
jgi:uncharacterized membrane protein YphA (DoxX/SURF4 family)